MNELTGRTLDRAIAVALGWRVKRIGFDDGRKPRPAVFAPNESDYAPAQWLSDERMEELRWDFDKAAELLWDGLMTVFAFHADANAVIAVCVERGWRLTFGRNAKGLPAATIEIWGEGFKSYSGHGATPQEAGARALLAALTGESEATA